MPYLSICISKQVDSSTKNKLQLEIGKIISIIPGKTVSNTTINISDNHTMYKDTIAFEGAFVDVRLYKNSPEESKKEFAMQIFQIFESILQIPNSNVQINFIEMPAWASNGNYF